jgi:hypothetical protein
MLHNVRVVLVALRILGVHEVFEELALLLTILSKLKSHLDVGSRRSFEVHS